PEEKTKLTKELRETVAMLVWLEPDDIKPNTSLSDVDLDSLGRVELIALVEKHLGAMLEEKDIPIIDTVAGIVEFAEKMETELQARIS
ncbi:MAG: acyl carrier protein, partial [Myxococcota bacterium]